MTLRVAITGANGFVGQALAARLVLEGGAVTGIVRRQFDAQFPLCVVSGLDDKRLALLLADCDVVVHTAARAHVMTDEAEDPMVAYRSVNVDGTLAIARMAAAQGVRRFVFISSIKVNGESTASGAPYSHDSVPAPEDAYGISKHEAEQALKQLAAETGMEVVIIRPPLVYGPGVKGNFAAMVRLVNKSVPLPLGAIRNARSLVALDNLVDLIIVCVSHPAAAGQVFLVSDGEEVSTTELLRQLARAMGKRQLLLPVPSWVFKVGLGLLGKKAVADRLCGSLVVDIRHTEKVLGWHPPISLMEGLREMIDASGG